MNNQPTYGSLFTGIGGFDLAAERAGFRVVYNCEINAYCRKVLARHFPCVQQFKDVRKCSPPCVHVISGGFPCQDISIAKSWTTQNQFLCSCAEQKKRSAENSETIKTYSQC